MFLNLVIATVFLALGYAAGGWQMGAKLKAIGAELKSVESYASSEARVLVARIRMHL